MPNLKLTSMKLDPSKAEKRDAALMEPDPPKYPFGLTVELNDDSLAALGLKKELPDVGEKMSLVARVEVTAVSSHEHAKGGAHRSVSLQITDLALGPDEAGEKPKAQDVLYRDGAKETAKA